MTERPLSLKLFAACLIGLAAVPALAQETGPSGIAEPHYRGGEAKAAAVAATPATGTTAPKLDPANIFNVQLGSGGVVSILLRPDKAPLATERLKTLAGRHFYDGTVFHRVIEDFMAQGGDPKGTGEGGSDLPDLKSEFNDLPHVRGVLAMARAGDVNSANSQFYIMLSPNLALDERYTVVGRVFAGMAYVDHIEKGEPPAHPTKIVRAWIGEPPADPATPPVEDAPKPMLSAPGSLIGGNAIAPGAQAKAPAAAPAAKAPPSKTPKAK
jgi:cyclophilin family peptidyl-prolyl cis-trans isomerase